MYGLIGRFIAAPGKREALLSILMESIERGERMQGCLSYVVARDPADPAGIRVTEVWDGAESHKAALALPSVKDAISRAMPLIAGFREHFETEPLGGVGLPGDGDQARR
jgi:quinol monooxygenase YgiN